jgi:membrane protease YdiL (CAAX protease family)
VIARVAAARTAAWWPQATALVLATAALGAALLVPYTFSDPNGVDPYVARISGVALLLLAVGYAQRALAATRPVLLALCAVTVSFTLLAATPQILTDLFGDRAPSFDAQIFWASLAQFIATAAFAVAAWRRLASPLRPQLRVDRLGWAGVAVALAASVVLMLVTLALPASLLGRLALQPVALTRDLPWLWPANALQALSQELQFRGLLMGALERVMSRRWANVAQACFFGFSHLAVNYQGPVAPFVPVTIAAGLLLGWMVQRTGSLWTAVGVHAVADVLITIAVLPGLYGY